MPVRFGSEFTLSDTIKSEAVASDNCCPTSDSCVEVSGSRGVEETIDEGATGGGWNNCPVALGEIVAWLASCAVGTVGWTEWRSRAVSFCSMWVAGIETGNEIGPFGAGDDTSAGGEVSWAWL